MNEWIISGDSNGKEYVLRWKEGATSFDRKIIAASNSYYVKRIGNSGTQGV